MGSVIYFVHEKKGIKLSERLNSGSASAGAVDEESFLTAFEDVPQVHLFSAKDLEEHFKSIRDTIGDDKKDWNQRIDQVSF